MRKCSKCNSVIENDSAKFCKKCGTALPPVIKKVDNEPVHLLNRDDGISLGTQRIPVSSVQNRKSETRHFVQPTVHKILDDKENKTEKSNKNMIWAIKACFKKYVTFEGRASRSEYWYFVLFNNLVFCSLLSLAFAFNHDIVSPILCVIALLYMLVTILPGLAVSVRRLHDIGKSGSYFFISFIPYIGGLVLLYFFCKASEKGDNMYGETN